MNSKRYVLSVVGVLSALVLFNAFIWEFYTKQWFAQNELYVGDLSRLGYLPDSAHPRKTYTDLQKLHMIVENISPHSKIDMVVIGDSFVKGLAGGLNPRFTDYIATYYNLNVLAIDQHPATNNYIETIALLVNSGLLDQLKVKTVLIESTQRQLVRRFGGEINFSSTDASDSILKKYKTLNSQRNSDEVGEQSSKVGFINDGNLKFVLNKMIYQFTNTSPLTNVVVHDLNQSLFSTKNGHILLNFKRDVVMKDEQKIENLEKINTNLNILAQILSKKGIKLIFMPAASKYTIYEPFIVGNTYSPDRFYEHFCAFKKNYFFVNTKKILNEAMPVQDLYYGDDTHWSYKASQLVINSQEFRCIINKKGLK